MNEAIVELERDRRGIATLRLNRPAVNNAYDDTLIAALGTALAELADDPTLRLVVLRGNGKHFQAGADLAFLRRLTAATAEENLAFSRATVAAIHGLQNFPRPTLALIHGGCFGGGVGMAAACDMAIATEDAIFSLTETRWGVTPAPVMPALIAAMGSRALLRYALTGERFDAAEAMRLGLIHAIAGKDRLDVAAEPILEGILMAGPEAVAVTKRLIRSAYGVGDPGPEAREALAREGAARRHAAEAAEGLASFAEKRPPRWYPQGGDRGD